MAFGLVAISNEESDLSRLDGVGLCEALAAMVVKCGQLSPDTAMKSTLWAQAAEIVREVVSPRA